MINIIFPSLIFKKSNHMNQLVNSKISFVHLSIVLVVAVLLCFFIYVLAIPIGYWMAFGEGAESSMIDSLPINIFIGNWGALILVLFTCTIALFINVKRQNFIYAKSYLITMVIVPILYLFRLQIGNLLIN